MCGIAGFAGNFEPILLEQMASRIAHRGPDDRGQIIFNHTVGLAHQRLAIIDLSKHGQQPMTVNCDCCRKDLWLTYNGELYNYKELRAELKAKGHQFQTNTDSEVLLHLYAQEGVSMLKRLNGIFAFAIYDGADPNTLFLARDGMGVKPLYYSETPSGFLFASELKALLASNEVSTSIDYLAIHYHLAYLWCPGNQTAINSIKKIEPGQAIIVSNGKITKQWSYYDIPYQGRINTGSEKSICEELYHYLYNAVERQLVSDVSVGAFLSGGLDSSAIVAMMKQINPDKMINAYCIGFKEGMSSEGNSNDIPYAKKVAKHLNVNLHTLEVTSDIINNLPAMLYHLDEPQADPAPIHVYLISKTAKDHNVKVLLSGAGGDDIFSGYRRHQSLQLEKVWKMIPSNTLNSLARMAAYIQDGKSSLRIMRSSSIRRMAKIMATVNLPVDERIAHHFLWSSDRIRHSLYTKDMQDSFKHVCTLAPLLTSLQDIPHETDPLNRMLYLEGKYFLPCHNLNYTDKMSMAMGIEVRVPFLDPDLVQFATQIPSHMKQKNSVSKAIFKKAMEPFLPKSVIYRSKAGFGAPLRRWLNNELKSLVYDTLSIDSLKRRNIFDPIAVQKLLKLNESGRIDASYTIFSLLCIELWAKQFVDQRAAIKPQWQL